MESRCVNELLGAMAAAATSHDEWRTNYLYSLPVEADNASLALAS
jgi:hypothetical protein